MPNPNVIRDELEDCLAVKARLEVIAATWHDVIVQGVDLTDVDDELASRSIHGCGFLGCTLGPKVARAVAASQCNEDPTKRCLVFPALPNLPFNPYRGKLYSPVELLWDYAQTPNAKGYDESVDWKSYLTFADPKTTKPYRGDSIDVILARRLHDTSIADALDDMLEPIRIQKPGAKKGVVAIMGGHDLPRREKQPKSEDGHAVGDDDWEGMTDDTVYTRVALLAWRLTNLGYLLVSGGGPGAMEAANLGAYFATRTVTELRAAIKSLEIFPEFISGRSGEWLAPALQVMQDFPLTDITRDACTSVGIPTWFYGHEPPAPFATHLAKYFENSVREEGMLAIATHGVIFADGNAGTVQEIFQDACQNYYGTYGTAAPMILFGVDYWDPPTMPVYVNDKRKKAFPLLHKLAEEKGFTHRVLVTDSMREIVTTITKYKP